jgi:hypothetical protein
MVDTRPLVWVKDDAGNRFLCPMEALLDPKYVPGEGRLHFGPSHSPA